MSREGFDKLFVGFPEDDEEVQSLCDDVQGAIISDLTLLRERLGLLRHQPTDVATIDAVVCTMGSVKLGNVDAVPAAAELVILKACKSVGEASRWYHRQGDRRRWTGVWWCKNRQTLEERSAYGHTVLLALQGLVEWYESIQPLDDVASVSN